MSMIMNDYISSTMPLRDADQRSFVSFLGTRQALFY